MPSWSGQSCAREKVRQYGEKRRSEREGAHPVAEVIWEETNETADEAAEATDEVAPAEEAEEELRAKYRVSLSVATKIRERGEGTHVSAASEDEDESSAAAEEEDSAATVDVADSAAADEVAEPRSSETLTPTAAQYCRRVARQHGLSSLGRTKEDQERTSSPTAAPAWSSSAEHSPCMQLDTSVRNVSDEHRHWMSLDAHDVEPAAEAMQVTTLRGCTRMGSHLVHLGVRRRRTGRTRSGR